MPLRPPSRGEPEQTGESVSKRETGDGGVRPVPVGGLVGRVLVLGSGPVYVLSVVLGDPLDGRV